jgi:lysophospholipase L1-like esterase
MTLARAGALAVFVTAGAVGAIGLYLTFGLVASALHPVSVSEGRGDPKRTALTQPVDGEREQTVALAPPAGENPASPNPPAARPVTDSAPNPAAPSAPAPVEVAPPEPATPAGPVEVEVADPRVVSVGKARAGQEAAQDKGQGKRGLVILQIGDSHTSADFLTGELRRRLQARYGRGGTGYMTAGHPHIGVRSSSVKITASPGWTYKSLQRPDARVGEFWLSGYDAIATAAGETMSFASEQPITFDTIEIEVIGQPGGGAIDIRLDGNVATHYDLAASRIEPVVIRLLPVRGPTDKVHDISITTTSPGTVSLASVSIYNNHSGLTYNSVGYVGAQAMLLNKMSEKLFADDLVRINPQIVVLSFGTNEASNEHLDIAQYTKAYERIIGKIKAALPAANVVMILPPDFNEMPTSCAKDKVADAACRRAPPEVNVAANAGAATTLSAAVSAPECAWRTPAKLAQIRDAQRDIAKRHGLVYWNWASIMPEGECGAHQWFTASPPLMSRDHVHFTGEGYKKSAEQFLNTLIPVIEKVRVGANVIPNN